MQLAVHVVCTTAPFFDRRRKWRTALNASVRELIVDSKTFPTNFCARNFLFLVTTVQRPLSIAEHSTITQLPTGYEPVSLAVKDVLQPAIYDWTDTTAPIIVTKKEELENSGEKAIVKIVEARMRSVMSMLRRELNKQVLTGGSSILTTLNTLLHLRPQVF
jgi:hypothetical protein